MKHFKVVLSIFVVANFSATIISPFLADASGGNTAARSRRSRKLSPQQKLEKPQTLAVSESEKPIAGLSQIKPKIDPSVNKKASSMVPPPPPMVPAIEEHTRPKSGELSKAEKVEKASSASRRKLPLKDAMAADLDDRDFDWRPDSVSALDSLSDTYRLEPGDVLTVVDPTMGSAELPAIVEVPVGPDGTIYIHPYGKIMARGRTIAKLTNLLNRIASRFTDNPEIIVELERQRPIYVYVLGDVVSPGLWNSNRTPSADQTRETISVINTEPIANSQRSAPRQFFTPVLGSTNSAAADHLMTPPRIYPSPALAALPLTALTAIQLAGGVRDSADIHHIRVTRRTADKVMELDLWKMIVEGDFTQDRLLQTGDTVYVPRSPIKFDPDRLGLAANPFKYVRIWGEVRAPGLYILQPQDDIYSVIARAGGFTAVAGSKIELNRELRDGTVLTRTIKMDPALRHVDAITRERLMPGDVIVARASLMKKYGPSFANKVALGAGAVGLLVLSRSIVDHSISNGTTASTVRLGF